MCAFENRLLVSSFSESETHHRQQQAFALLQSVPMQPADDAQFIVSYIHVAKSCAAAAVDALRSFHSASSSDACHIACLQREGDSYLGQYVLFIFAQSPLLLLQCTSSAAFAALTAAIDAMRVAPLIVKRFRSVATSAPVDAREMVRHFTGSSAALFTVTHLDVIPSIPGNVDRAHALLQHEVSSLNGLQQQQQHASSCIDGCFMFFGLQQTDRANHFTLVQVCSHSHRLWLWLCKQSYCCVRAGRPRSIRPITTTVMPRYSRSSSTV